MTGAGHIFSDIKSGAITSDLAFFLSEIVTGITSVWEDLTV